MEYYLSMVRDHLIKSGLTVSDLNGSNSKFRSFRIETPGKRENDLLYLRSGPDGVSFSCAGGSFSLYGPSLSEAVSLVLEVFERYDRWERALMSAVWGTPDYQTLIDVSDEIFENPMLITNWQGKVLGYSSSYRETKIRDFWNELVDTGILPISCLQNLRESSHFDILKDENQVNFLHFEKFDYTCILGLTHENHEITLHFQIIEYNRKITGSDLLLARIFLSALKRAHQEIRPVNQESATYIFSQLLAGEHVNGKLLAWVMSSLGWSFKTMFYLICFRPMDKKGNTKSMLMQLERAIPGSKVLIHENLPVMLLARPLFERFRDDILYINRKWHLKCGISMPFNEWNSLRLFFYQGSVVAENFAGNDNGLHFCEDHIWYFMREDLKSSLAAGHMKHPAVQILAKYDRRNNTEFLKTLRIFLLCERNSTLTAKKLNIHRNTLQYRLHKINALIRTDLDDPDTRLHLLMTCILSAPEED